MQVAITRLAEDDAGITVVPQVSDQVMETMLRVFNFRDGTVHEDALLVVGAMTNALGEGFVKYMEPFFPVLEMGLANHQVIVGVGVVCVLYLCCVYIVYAYCMCIVFVFELYVHGRQCKTKHHVHTSSSTPQHTSTHLHRSGTHV